MTDGARIKNHDAIPFIKEHRAFSNTSNTFYAFNDVNNVYGVFSCGKLVAKVFTDGAYERLSTKSIPSWSHAQVINEVLPEVIT